VAKKIKIGGTNNMRAKRAKKLLYAELLSH